MDNIKYLEDKLLETRLLALLILVSFGLLITSVALFFKVNNTEKAISAFSTYTNQNTQVLQSHKIVIENLIAVVNNHAERISTYSNSLYQTDMKYLNASNQLRKLKINERK